MNRPDFRRGSISRFVRWIGTVPVLFHLIRWVRSL